MGRERPIGGWSSFSFPSPEFTFRNSHEKASWSPAGRLWWRGGGGRVPALDVFRPAKIPGPGIERLDDALAGGKPGRADDGPGRTEGDGKIRGAAPDRDVGKAGFGV